MKTKQTKIALKGPDLSHHNTGYSHCIFQSLIKVNYVANEVNSIQNAYFTILIFLNLQPIFFYSHFKATVKLVQTLLD